VVEVAAGAELVASAYRNLLARRADATTITTACPAVVNLVEIHFPELIPHLAPVVSPMIALGRMLKQEDPDLMVVFAGPCVAKKDEIERPSLRGAVDAVLTFGELEELLTEYGIDPARHSPGLFDPPHPGLARAFPVSGGLLRVAGLAQDVLLPEIEAVEGPARCLRALRELAGDHGRRRVLDILFCEGCIDGPALGSPLSLPERRARVARYTREQPECGDLPAATGVDLGREFTDRRPFLPTASEEQLREVLAVHYGFRADDELDCGACGYDSCREKALAVFRGLAEAEMCLPHLLQRADDRLADSAERMRRLREEMLQSEKLVALGQFSAGIAHEINNPLGAILLLAASVLEEMPADHPGYSDLVTVVKEAERCRGVVSDLLNFARQTPLRREPTDVNRLLNDETEVLLRTRSPEAPPIDVDLNLLPELPLLAADAARLRQVFRNVIQNAIDAMVHGGRLTISTRVQHDEQSLVVDIHDTGVGIPRANLSRLFNPFFTTKPSGRGTGLGLATAYGIVKMHGGEIRVASEAGQGTRFSVCLPLTVTRSTDAPARDGTESFEGREAPEDGAESLWPSPRVRS
jgi:signal transduction histidine kinase